MDQHNILAAVDAFLLHLAHDRGCTPATIQGYTRDLMSACDHFARAGVAATVSAVTHDAVLAWLREPTRAGAHRSARGRNRRLAVLRSFFRWTRAEGVRADDPTLGVPWARVHPRDPPSLSAGEVRRLVDAARANPHPWFAARDEAVLVMLIQSGLRLGELAALDVEDVDLADARLRGVRRKGGEHKDLVVNREVVRVLRAWIRVRGERAAEDESALFVSRQRRRLAPRSVQALVHRYAAAAGMTVPLRVHTLRHVFAYEVQQRGRASMRTAQELLNHQRMETTALYSRSTEADKRAALRELEGLTAPRLSGRKGCRHRTGRHA